MPYAASLIDWIALFALLTALIAAALSDAVTFSIPNRYSAIIAAAFLLFAIGKPLEFTLGGLAVGGLLLIGGAFLFARGILGGGDVKLLAACGFWAGQDRLSLLLYATAFAGGALALAQLSPLHRLMPSHPGAAGAAAPVTWRERLRQPVPLGIAIAFGGVCVALSHTAP